MVGKCIRGGICPSIYSYEKLANTLKDNDTDKELSYLQSWDVNNLWDGEMSQKPPEKSFEWIEDTSQFNEDLIKIYNEEYFVKLIINILKNYMNFIKIYHFYLRK